MVIGNKNCVARANIMIGYITCTCVKHQGQSVVYRSILSMHRLSQMHQIWKSYNLHCIYSYIFPCCPPGLVTVVVFITVCVLAVMTRLLYLQRRVQKTSSIRQKEHRHSIDTENRTELHLHSSLPHNMKEYYI